MQILIGADPEVFVKNSAGEFRSAHGLVPGTKREPFKVPKGAIQVDGNALEFNIDPADTKTSFIGNIREVYEEIRKMVPGYNVVVEPVAVFEKAYFDALPAEARELGCEPDFNAWTRSVNERPVNTLPMSVAGGHIHIGWTDGVDPFDPSHFDDCCDVTKQMDFYLGMWSLTVDKDQMRRALYGKAGSFRPKPYGCEYRSLSNFWLQSEELQGWVYDAAMRGMNDLMAGRRAFDVEGNLAQEIINNGELNWGRMHNDCTGLSMPPGGYWGKKKVA